MGPVVVEELRQVLAKVVEGERRIGGPPAQKAERYLFDPRLAQERDGVRAAQGAVGREETDDRPRRRTADRVDRSVYVL